MRPKRVDQQLSAAGNFEKEQALSGDESFHSLKLRIDLESWLEPR